MQENRPIWGGEPIDLEPTMREIFYELRLITPRPFLNLGGNSRVLSLPLEYDHIVRKCVLIARSFGLPASTCEPLYSISLRRYGGE